MEGRDAGWRVPVQTSIKLYEGQIGQIGQEEEMKELLLDPKAFNYLIMVLYGLNSLRWYFYGSWGDVCYWLSALAITASVTWGYTR